MTGDTLTSSERRLEVLRFARDLERRIERVRGSDKAQKIALRLVREFFELKPAGIISSLDLLRPVFKETAAYGHFGRGHFSWEQTDKAELLRDA